MRRLLVVEMEAVVDMADGVDAFVQRQPVLGRARRGRETPVRIIGRIDRVLRKGVQDVGVHQFLMLLLVVQPDLDQRRDGPKLVFASLAEEFCDRRIDISTIGANLIGARPGDVAAVIPGMARTGADVIGIEQEREIGVEGLVVRAVFTQQKLLPEPGGVRPVPFRGAGIRHGLDLLVLGGQRRGPALGLVADGGKRVLKPPGEAALVEGG